MPPSTDFCIVGGGLVGALMALQLAERGYTIALVERKKASLPDPTRPLDTRALALNYGSIQLFKAWGCADLLRDAHFISNIHVSDKGHRGIVHIQAEEEKLPYLGAVIPFEGLLFALQEKVLLTPQIHFLEGQFEDFTLESKITIAADGADSSIRKQLGIQTLTHDYKASALIGKVRVKKQVSDAAFERFTSEGPIALLPVGKDLYTIVWIRPDDRPPSACLLKELQDAFGYRAGIFIEHGIMKTYPLKRICATETHQGTIGLLGNAAHTLHPVAGQGFNLAVRDILTFLEVLDMQPTLDTSLWAEYTARAAPQQKKLERLTHAFVKGFEGNRPLIAQGRTLLLALFEGSSFARSELNNIMVGKY